VHETVVITLKSAYGIQLTMGIGPWSNTSAVVFKCNGGSVSVQRKKTGVACWPQRRKIPAIARRPRPELET
jgi:hypothetical protein